MKRKSWLLIGSFVLLGSLLLVGAGCSILTKKDVTSSAEWDRIFQGIELDSLPQHIKVATDVISVRIEPSPDEKTRIQLNSTDEAKFKENFHFNLNEASDRLEVQVEGVKNMKLNVLNIGNTLKAELHIQLPENEYKSMDIKSNVGKIQYSEMNVEQLTVTNDVGAIFIEGSETNQAKIHNSVGAIQIHHLSGDLKISNHTGAVQLNMPRMDNDIEIKSDVGSVTVTFDNKLENLKLDLATEIGSIKTNLGLQNEKASNKAWIGQVGSGKPQLKIRTEIGKIEVNESEANS